MVHGTCLGWLAASDGGSRYSVTEPPCRHWAGWLAPSHPTACLTAPCSRLVLPTSISNEYELHCCWSVSFLSGWPYICKHPGKSKSFEQDGDAFCSHDRHGQPNRSHKHDDKHHLCMPSATTTPCRKRFAWNMNGHWPVIMDMGTEWFCCCCPISLTPSHVLVQGLEDTPWLQLKGQEEGSDAPEAHSS